MSRAAHVTRDLQTYVYEAIDFPKNSSLSQFDVKKIRRMISFHFVSTCVICASEGPGRQEILRRRYLVGLVGVATLVNRQETGNYQAEEREGPDSSPEVQDDH